MPVEAEVTFEDVSPTTLRNQLRGVNLDGCFRSESAACVICSFGNRSLAVRSSDQIGSLMAATNRASLSSPIVNRICLTSLGCARSTTCRTPRIHALNASDAFLNPE